MGSADIKNLFNIVEEGSTSSLSDFLKEISQTVDISLRTFVNQRNDQNQTVLHISCLKLFPDIAQMLLEVGADPNVQDLDGRTPVFALVDRLHECDCEDCLRKATRCLATLSFHGGSVDIPNGSDVTPLYLCAEYHFVDFTKSLLEKGAALGTVKGRPIIEVLAEKVPGVMETVLDRAVKMNENKSVHDPNYELTFDLGVILPAQITLNSHINGSNNGNINQVFPTEQWFQEKYDPCEEMTFLKDILDFSGHDSGMYKILLKHPLVTIFTDIKWRSLETLYYLSLFMQLNVLIAYTAFICATIFLDCPYDLYVNLRNGLNHISSHAQKNGFPDGLNITDVVDPDKLCEINIISKILSVFVVLILAGVLLKEMQHAMYDIKDYLKDVFNYFQLVGFTSVIFTVIIAWDQHSRFYSLLYPVAAFGIAVSWCQIFVQIGRLPQLAIFVEMFVKICANFCLSLLMYSFLLIGFGMSYIILFIKKPILQDIPLSLTKVLTMLVGELDYEDMFKDENFNLQSENSNDSSHSHNSSNTTFSIRRFSARVWYVNFVIFITLVLSNLLVGLAVSDIQGIRKNAEMYVIKRRIRYIAYLEKSLFEATAYIPNFIRKSLRENICVARTRHGKKMRSCFSPMFKPIELKNCKIVILPNALYCYPYLSDESKGSIRHWLSKKSLTFTTRKCGLVAHNTVAGFRQRNLANFRKSSETSFITSPMFVKESSHSNDSERLKKLEFGMQQMDKKITELDVKLDTILNLLLKPDND